MEERIEWVDVARGIGIVLVVLGHVVSTDIRNDYNWAKSIYDGIYFFHMPLLLLLSGYSFQISEKKYRQLSFSIYFINKFKRLMVPYIFYSLLVYICFSFAHMTVLSSLISKAGFEQISFVNWALELLTGNNLYSQHLWYIYTLFILSLITFIFLKHFERTYKYIILVLTVILYLYWIPLSFTEIDIVWKTALRGIWFALGCCLDVNLFLKEKKKYLFGCVCTFLACYMLKQLNLYKNVIEIINFMMVICCVVFIIIISNSKLLFNRVFNYLGKKSFIIYLFHQPFCASACGVFLYKICGINIYISMILTFLVSIIVPLVIERVLENKNMCIIKRLLLGI